MVEPRSSKARQLVAVSSLLVVGATVALLLYGIQTPATDHRIAWVSSLDPAIPEPADLVRQRQDTDCGPAVLKMVFNHYGLDEMTLEEIEAVATVGANGTNLLALKKIAESQGLRAQGLRLSIENLADVPLPAIAHVHGDHFVLLRSVGNEVVVDDPSVGRLRMSSEALDRAWNGVVLTFLPVASQDHVLPERGTE